MGMKIRLSVVLLLALLLAACGSAAEDGDLDRPDYPKGANDLVFSISNEGGFVPVEFNLTRLPDLAVYGDGRVISQGPQILIFPGPALPNLLVRRLTPEGLDSLVGKAATAGLTGPDRSFRAAADRVTDLPDTVFRLVTEEGEHTTSVYGFGSGEDLNAAEGTDRASIQALHTLRDELTNLEATLPAGSVGPEEFYEMSELRVFVSSPPVAEEGLEQTPAVWPLAQPLTEFGAPVQPEGFRCGTVAGEDLVAVLEVVNQANQLTPWADSAGLEYGLSFRPLLPDETGCP